jgi:hypothetical protein
LLRKNVLPYDGPMSGGAGFDREISPALSYAMGTHNRLTTAHIGEAEAGRADGGSAYASGIEREPMGGNAQLSG